MCQSSGAVSPARSVSCAVAVASRRTASGRSFRAPAFDRGSGGRRRTGPGPATARLLVQQLAEHPAGCRSGGSTSSHRPVRRNQRGGVAVGQQRVRGNSVCCSCLCSLPWRPPRYMPFGRHRGRWTSHETPPSAGLALPGSTLSWWVGDLIAAGSVSSSISNSAMSWPPDGFASPIAARNS